MDRDSPSAMEAELDRLLGELTLDEKISLVHANSKFTVAGVERLGISEMTLSDGPHGVREQISRDSWASANWTTDFATYLPPLTTVAASWDPEVARVHGYVLGREARDRGKDIILGPGVNLARLPVYGRNFEYFGEDPYLAARMVVPVIKAIQESDVAACVKHYALNTQELNRWGVNAQPDERTLREIYLPAFEAAVKEGGVYSVMGAYNKVYGTNANQSKKLVTDILKDEWGFDGVLLTDWHVDINTYDAAMHGLDLEMGTQVDSYDDYFFAQPLLTKIKQKEIPEAVLDEKVRRVLRLQMRIGKMDNTRSSGARNTDEHRKLAQHIAEQGIVLLKNASARLPLDKSRLKSILVLGPNANAVHGRGGGSSQVKAEYEITPLQGLRDYLGDDVEIHYMRAAVGDDIQPISADFINTRQSGAGIPAWKAIGFKDRSHTQFSWYEEWVQSTHSWAPGSDVEHLILQAELAPMASGEHVIQFIGAGAARLEVDAKTVFQVSGEETQRIEKPLLLEAGKSYEFKLFYDGNQHFTLGWDAPGLQVATKAEYQRAAREADAVIYFAGLSHSDDREGQDRESMTLPYAQDEVIANLREANPNTIVFMVAGSAVEMPWADKIDSIVWGWYGGMHAGRAYARMLFGELNPGGKLPITLPERLEQSAPIALDDYNEQEVLYKEGVFIGYRWYEQQGLKPLFPFGHGLSYTQFDISELELPTQPTLGDDITVSVMVKNTGNRAGAEVVQLYIGDRDASVPQPQKALKGFAKVFLQPGESSMVILVLSPRDLSFWDVKTQQWQAEPGVFNVYVGSSSDDIRQTGSFALL